MSLMKKDTSSYSKALLTAAVLATYDDSRFFGGEACEPDADFHQGLTLNRSRYYSKVQFLNMLAEFAEDTVPTMPEHPNHLILSRSIYLSAVSVLEEQQYPPSVPVEGFTHVFSKNRPHYDIYYRMDYERKQITFALADRIRAFAVKELTEWCWKPTRSGILCQNIGKLDRDFRDPFWNEIAVYVGRKMLGFPGTLSALLKTLQKKT